MDIASMSIGLGIMLGFVLPIWWVNHNKNQKVKKKLAKLNTFATKQGFQISETEVVKDITLGIDKPNNRVFFMNASKNIETTIDLQNIKKCTINEVSKNVEINGIKQQLIDKIELLFYPLDNTVSTIAWEFYNQENGNLQLFGQHQFLEKWVVIINTQISKIGRK